VIAASRAPVLALSLALLLAATEAAAKPALAPGERIDVNRAGAAELMRLPGVGRRRAEAILAQRAKKPFRRPEDLALVKGLSPAWVAKNRAHLEAGPLRAAGGAP
jgi:competence protein ComEA